MSLAALADRSLFYAAAYVLIILKKTCCCHRSCQRQHLRETLSDVGRMREEELKGAKWRNQ
jgi:hypothetical protein